MLGGKDIMIAGAHIGDLGILTAETLMIPIPSNAVIGLMVGGVLLLRMTCDKPSDNIAISYRVCHIPSKQ